nr:sensor histidine kinase [Terriglobales bacterium]
MYSGSVSPTPRWYWISAIWLGIGLFDATQTVVVMRSEGMHHAWTALFFATLLSWATWALATPFVIRIGNRYPLSRSRPGNWLIHLVTCLATGGVYAAWTAGLERVLNPWTPSAAPGPFLQLWLSKFTNSIVAFSFLYGTILLIGHVLDSRERLARQQMETARLNEQLSQAQLNALRRQIEPHFLF